MTAHHRPLSGLWLALAGCAAGSGRLAADAPGDTSPDRGVVGGDLARPDAAGEQVADARASSPDGFAGDAPVPAVRDASLGGAPGDVGQPAPTPDEGHTPPPPAPDAAGPAPPTAAPAPPAAMYTSTLTTFGLVDANEASYMYAPAFLYDGGRYHYFACVGVEGDWIRHKSAPTLAALGDAPWRDILRPDPGETHTCDPAVIRGDDGRFYLHYSNTPGGVYTDAGVAVADRLEGPYAKLTTDLLGRYDHLDPGQYGRGQTTVARGPDGLYYMAFTNQIAPLEPNAVVILQSPDPSFAVTRSEVTRFDAGVIGGYSTQLTYDPRANRFLFIEPAGAAGFLVTAFDTAWQRVAQETLPLPPGAGTPGEGQALLADAEGRLLHGTPDAPGALVVAGATEGPARGGLPFWITGPNQFRTFRVSPVGIVDAIEARPGAVRVVGWSFDPNDRAFPIDTHVYVGPNDDPRREGHNLGPTGTPRPDVNATQGTAGDHGFDAVLPTAFRGETQVCVAAINVGAGDNEWLTCRTVAVGD